MARSFHVHGPHGSRARAMLSTRSAAMFLMILFLTFVTALWMTGAPVESILPVEPPA
jgi:hypothetical protein